MTPEERAGARARCDAATEGPWVSGEGYEWEPGDIVTPSIIDEHIDSSVGPDHPDHRWSAARRVIATSWWADEKPEDFEFILAARTDLPAALDLLDALDRLHCRRVNFCDGCGRVWPCATHLLLYPEAGS